MLADLDDERVRRTGTTLVPPVPWFHVDVRSEESVSRLITEVVKTTGRIDALFNVHGVVVGRTNLEELPFEEWKFVLETNLNGTFLCMKHATLQMKKQGGGGCIINLTTGGPRPQQTPYFSSKLGIEALTAVAALELRPHAIGVYAVAPGGYLSTDFHDNSYGAMRYKNYIAEEQLKRQRRAIRPEVVVPLCLYLVEDASLAMTGTKIEVLHWNEEKGFGGQDAWLA